ncbi:hypothetical protein PM082_017537 [Marasmius tenuissimus]|nr:hypothetical protein PM082_017537 [Marasmius tenuissimus]
MISSMIPAVPPYVFFKSPLVSHCARESVLFRPSWGQIVFMFFLLLGMPATCICSRPALSEHISLSETERFRNPGTSNSYLFPSTQSPIMIQSTPPVLLS